MIINANGDPARFAPFGLPVVPDTIGGFVGPLAGVLAGMRWSAANTPAARWMVTAAGDAPLLPSDLVERLVQAVEDRQDAIALAQSHGELHPVIGLWPVALAEDLEEQLRGGVRKVLHWTDRHGTASVPFPPARVCGTRHRSVLQRQHAAGAGPAARHAGQDREVEQMKRAGGSTPVIGIAGWKKSGKTTLAVRLIAEFTRRGLKVATVKHAHHDFQIDDARDRQRPPPPRGRLAGGRRLGQALGADHRARRRPRARSWPR